jgi:hypothetical protein
MSDQAKPTGDQKPAEEVKIPEVVSIGSAPTKAPEVVVAPAPAV